MKEKLMNFMRGRYGHDELNMCLLIGAVVLNLLGGIWSFFSSLGMVCLFYSIYRAFSRNIYRRRNENAHVVPYVSFVRAKFKNKGKSKIFLCPRCKRTLRIPKGKGKVTLKCPCGESLKRKS